MTLLHICLRIVGCLRYWCWQTRAHTMVSLWDGGKHISRSGGAFIKFSTEPSLNLLCSIKTFKVTSVFGSILPVTRCIPDRGGELALLYRFPDPLDALSHTQIQAETSKEGLLGTVKIYPIRKVFKWLGVLYERDLSLLLFIFRLICSHMCVCACV